MLAGVHRRSEYLCLLLRGTRPHNSFLQVQLTINWLFWSCLKVDREFCGLLLFKSLPQELWPQLTTRWVQNRFPGGVGECLTSEDAASEGDVSSHVCWTVLCELEAECLRRLFLYFYEIASLSTLMFYDWRQFVCSLTVLHLKSRGGECESHFLSNSSRVGLDRHSSGVISSYDDLTFVSSTDSVCPSWCPSLFLYNPNLSFVNFMTLFDSKWSYLTVSEFHLQCVFMWE